jgi:hypothetical protein
MIITSPTGLYKSILPQGTESGNITYAISTQDPPRSNVRLIIHPIAEILTPAPDKIFDDNERRAQFGELIFTIAQSSRAMPGSNSKLFELGQALDFENSPPEQEIEPSKSPDNIEIRHNTNMLDLEGLGLTKDEIAQVTLDSEEKQSELEAEFLAIRTEIQNLDTEITENQKKINETNKAINAVREVYDIPIGDLSFDNDIYQKLLAGLTTLTTDREQFIEDRNDANRRLEETHQAVLDVSELVR